MWEELPDKSEILTTKQRNWRQALIRNSAFFSLRRHYFSVVESAPLGRLLPAPQKSNRNKTSLAFPELLWGVWRREWEALVYWESNAAVPGEEGEENWFVCPVLTLYSTRFGAVRMFCGTFWTDHHGHQTTRTLSHFSPLYRYRNYRVVV